MKEERIIIVGGGLRTALLLLEAGSLQDGDRIAMLDVPVLHKRDKLPPPPMDASPYAETQRGQGNQLLRDLANRGKYGNSKKELRRRNK
ncbi:MULTISPECIES: hypothetical protein [unclassified Bradyrhizobium]|uniref:hypothetical protein n=1 Tax=unclassified Bradyrhizobium TaxID=2631580 RepID=UPI00339497E6